MHIKHAVEKLKHLEKEEKKQIIAKKMGGAKLDKGDWPRAKVPQFLHIPKGKGSNKASWPKNHPQPAKMAEI